MAPTAATIGVRGDGIGAHEPGPIDEELDPGGRVQRRDLVLVLTRDPEDLPARHDHAETGRGPQDLGDADGGPRQELLEVVEDEQGGQRLETFLERPGDRHARFLADVERRGDRARDQVRIADRGEIDEPRPAREAVRDRRREPKAEPRLAGATGSRQGQESRPPKDVAQGHEVFVAADEVRRRCRQVRRRVDRPQRPIVVGDARDDEQVDRPRILEILEASRTHRREAQPVRDPAADAVAGGLRDGDLPAVRGRCDPCRVVHVDADVIATVVGRPSDARVEADPDPHRLGVVDRQCRHRAADPSGSGEGVGRLGEDREGPVALVLDDLAAGGRHGPVDQRVVLAQERHPPFAIEPLRETRRALDVGEEERDAVTGRQVHARILRCAHRAG